MTVYYSQIRLPATKLEHPNATEQKLVHISTDMKIMNVCFI